VLLVSHIFLLTDIYCSFFVFFYSIVLIVLCSYVVYLQCFVAVGWVTGRASGL